MLRWIGFIALTLLLVSVATSQASQFGGGGDAPSTFEVRPQIHVPPPPAEEAEAVSEAMSVAAPVALLKYEHTASAETGLGESSQTLASESATPATGSSQLTTTISGWPPKVAIVADPSWPTSWPTHAADQIAASTSESVIPPSTTVPGPAPTATAAPLGPRNVPSAGALPVPTYGITWFAPACSSENSGAVDWEIVTSGQPGALTFGIGNASQGVVLICDVYLANSGAASISVERVVADFDPAVLTLDADLGERVTLESCGTVPAFSDQPATLPVACWQKVQLTIRLGAPLALDWLTAGVVVTVIG